MSKKIDLTLPEWVFWDGISHEGDTLHGRTIIEHVRSATIIEILDRDHDEIHLKPDVLSFKFKNRNLGEERLIAVLHHSCTLDPADDRSMLLEIMKKCAVWYCDYCDWEDDNIINDIMEGDNDDE